MKRRSIFSRLFSGTMQCTFNLMPSNLSPKPTKTTPVSVRSVTCPLARPLTRPFIYRSVRLSMHPFCPSDLLSIRPSVFLSIHPPVRLSLPVSPSTRLSFSIDFLCNFLTYLNTVIDNLTVC